MIKIKVSEGKAHIIIKGGKFEVANEVVNIAIALIERLGNIDGALGAATKKTVIDALEGRIKPYEETEVEE